MKATAKSPPSTTAPTRPPARTVSVRPAIDAAAPGDRRTTILLAAEKLFALHGYHAVSIRDIAKEAGVPLALVGYYHGAKHELFQAIFDSWGSVIAGRRQALQAVCTEPDPERRLDAILRTFALPLIDLHQHPEGRYYAMMAARDLASPTPEADRVHRELFDPLAHEFIDALVQIGPRISRGRAAWCYQFMLGTLIHFLSDTRVERLSGGENRAADPAAAGELLAFLGAGARALLQPQAPAPRKTALRRAPR